MRARSPRSAAAFPHRAGWWPALLLVLVAVLLGIYADVGQYAGGFWGLLPELGAPWVLLAFASGRVANRRPLVAAGSGLLLILGGLVSYALFVHVVHEVRLYNVVRSGGAYYWAAWAALLGPLAGLAGSWSVAGRSTLRPAGWAFAVGVPLAECVRVSASDYLDARGVIASLLVLAAVVALFALREVRLLPLTAAVGAWVGVGLATLLLLHAT